MPARIRETISGRHDGAELGADDQRGRVMRGRSGHRSAGRRDPCRRDRRAYVQRVAIRQAVGRQVLEQRGRGDGLAGEKSERAQGGFALVCRRGARRPR